MQNRLSQGLRALKYLKALMSTETHSGADMMPGMAGRGVLTKAQPHEEIKGRCTQQNERRRNLSFSLLAYFVVTETEPRASHMPGKHPISSYISSLALY